LICHHYVLSAPVTDTNTGHPADPAQTKINRIRAADQSRVPTILIVHPGMDDWKSWRKAAGRLVARFRVARLLRRQYWLDIGSRSPCTTAQEAQDVLAVAKAIGEPTLVVRHSSGRGVHWRRWLRRRRPSLCRLSSHRS
jgi:pimeloyl-ACP methyl ester carboxylesterase